MRMPGESEAGASGSHGGSDPTPAGGDFAALAPDLTRRIGTILDAVQREADKMLDEARGEAQRHVEVGKRQADGLLADRQRRIAALSDTLIERTEAVVAQLEETALVRESFGRLLRALSAAADEVTTRSRRRRCRRARAAPGRTELRAAATVCGHGARAAERARGCARAAAGRSAARRPRLGRGPPGGDPDGRRGQHRGHRSRHTCAASCTSPTPAPLLDQVFGAATAGEARVPWAIVPSAPPAQPENAGG